MTLQKGFIIKNGAGSELRVEKINDFLVKLSLNNGSDILLNSEEWDELGQVKYEIYLDKESDECPEAE